MNVRYFSGSREQAPRAKGMKAMMDGSSASSMMRIEIMKKGKMPANERYKRIMKKKYEENKKKALGGNKSFAFKLPGSKGNTRGMSKRAEMALEQIAMKKAAKEEKALRRMVLITPRTYPTGKLYKNGKIYDVAGNQVATVNRKNGKVATTMGWNVGKYKPKSYFTDMMIQDTIHKYSPYYINLRKMQQMQQGSDTGVWGAASDAINVYGRQTAPAAPAVDMGLSQYYGSSAEGPRQNVGVTAWGAMSDNAWGTFADNVWGSSTDNVWGGNSTDVWGGIGVGGMWGKKSGHIWGTGNGTNYLKGLTSRVAAFFGLKSGGNKESRNAAFRSSRSGSSGPRTSAAATRMASAPTSTRR